MKKFIVVFVSAFLMCIVTFATVQANMADEKELILSHNQPTDHPVHKSLMIFAEKVEEKSDGKLKINVFPNERLGSEREAIEMTQSNAIQFTKVSASALESFSKSYSLFSMPYLFESQDEYRQIMRSEDVQNAFYPTTEDNGFIALTHYDAGVRNMYTSNREIETNEDMKGLRTRVQPSETNIQMIDALGGTPTPLSYGEVYTAFQSGMIDAAENNETALTSSNHGEVAKNYYYTEHAIVPDLLIMSKEAVDSLSDEEMQWINDAAEESSIEHEDIWNAEVETSIETAQNEMDVEFHDIDKSSFIEAVQPLQQSFREDEETRKQLEIIEEEADR